MMFMFCWGTCVGYVGSVQDLLDPLLNDKKYPAVPFLRTVTGHRLITALVWLVGMFTLSLPKQINTLRYASVVGVTFIIFFVICIIIHSGMHHLGGPTDLPGREINLATQGMEAVNGLTLFIYAFICQVNVFEIYEEMSPATKNPRTMTRDAAISMGCVALLNFLAGLFGYLDFRSEVTGTILLYYTPRQDALFFISYIGLCIKLCVGFAICIQPSRDAIYYCLRMGKTSDVPFWFNWIVSGLLAVLALICAFFIPDITIVFNLLGGICGCFLAFLFPAYFYLYSCCFSYKMKYRVFHIIGLLLLLVAGVVSLVFGTAASIYGMIDE
ncbi:amino acid permease [Angomonas deanei]|uniref:Transmembrane amino acid transporter protein, putative n=1 Tax=Angomonas deanei TaxID=59799 RepID=A0A7G2C8Q5_9TRYP|nr:amino acid permease [Angomonas deanei]CAD2216118.1 Transmembrane amino acid transporter protein, putative [Angomonas deanei]|eukprot:EPY41606.1 amino acid permease [Angomonas deanei]